MERGAGRRAVSAVVAAVVLVLAVWLLLSRRAAEDVAAPARVAVTPRERPAPESRSLPPRVLPEGDPPPDLTDEGAGPDEVDELTEDLEGLAADLVPMPDEDALAAAWAEVDLDEVRRAMPDNIYFEMSAPTTDEAVIAERAAERNRWNDAYGKVLSGTGTEEEVLAYYDMRARLSSDYLEFTTYLLDNHGKSLAERDVGLLELARRLHAARLQAIPRQVEEALERKRLQDAAREEWLADEAEFAAPDPDSE